MAKNSRTKNSILNLLTGFGGEFLVIILKFVTRMVFIATLGKAYLGINGLFSDILQMLSLTELGFDTAMNYKLYKPIAEGDMKRLRALMRFYKTVYRVIGIAILVLGLGLIPFLHFLIRDYDTLDKLGINGPLIFVLFLLQSVSSYTFFAYRSALMRAAQKGYVLNVIGYFVDIATNLIQITILYFLRNFLLYTAAVVLMNIVKNTVNAAVTARYFPDVFKKGEEKLSREEVVDTFKDCGALFIYKLNSVVLKATDNAVLSIFIGLSIVGVYSNYLMLYTTLKKVLNKFYASVKASMGDLFSTSDMDRKYRFFGIMNYITVILYGTACVGIAVVADEIVESMAGKSYLIPQPFALLVGIELLFAGLKTNLGQIRNITGVFRQMWFRPAIGALVNIAVSVATVQRFGIYGVIIGTITADLTTNFMVDPRIIHKYSFKNYRPVSDYYKRNGLYLLLLAAVGAGDYALSRCFLYGHGWFSVIVHMALCGVTVPAAFLLVYRNTEESRYLRKKAAGIWRKMRRK